LRLISISAFNKHIDMIDEVALVFISSLINPRMDLRTIDKREPTSDHLGGTEPSSWPSACRIEDRSAYNYTERIERVSLLLVSFYQVERSKKGRYSRMCCFRPVDASRFWRGNEFGTSTSLHRTTKKAFSNEFAWNDSSLRIGLMHGPRIKVAAARARQAPLEKMNKSAREGEVEKRRR